MNPTPKESQAAMAAQAPIEITTLTHAPSAQTPDGIEGLLAKAFEAGRTADELQGLLDVYERVLAKRAETAFNAALVLFRSNCPDIRRSRDSTQATRNGTLMGIKYAALEDVSRVVDPILIECGLVCTWPHIEHENGIVTTVTRVSHVDGHHADTPCSMPVASGAGMSEQQKVGSAITYCKRYGRDAALGIVTCSDDTDGVDPEPAETITDKQALQIEDLLSSLRDLDGNDGTKRRMLEVVGVEKIADIPAAQFEKLCGQIQTKIEAAK